MTEEKVLNIPLRKVHALEIVNGTKKREFRAFNDFWATRLCIIEDDMAVGLKWFDKVHFYPYNNKWFLDCKVNDIRWVTVDEEFATKYANEVEMPPMGAQIFVIELGEVTATNLG